MAAGVSRGVSAPTPEPAEMSAATAANVAAAVLRERSLRRANEQGYGQGWNGKSERQAEWREALHVRTLSANRGGRQRFYMI